MHIKKVSVSSTDEKGRINNWFASSNPPASSPCPSATCNPIIITEPPTGGGGDESSGSLESSGDEQEDKSVSDDDECLDPMKAFTNPKCAARTKTKVRVHKGTVYVFDRQGRLIAIVQKGMKIEIEWGQRVSLFLN